MTSGGNNFSNIPENKMTKFCALASCYCLLPLPSRSYFINTPRKHPPDNPLWTSDGWGVSHENWGVISYNPLAGLDKSLTPTKFRMCIELYYNFGETNKECIAMYHASTDRLRKTEVWLSACPVTIYMIIVMKIPTILSLSQYTKYRPTSISY